MFFKDKHFHNKKLAQILTESQNDPIFTIQIKPPGSTTSGTMSSSFTLSSLGPVGRIYSGHCSLVSHVIIGTCSTKRRRLCPGAVGHQYTLQWEEMKKVEPCGPFTPNAAHL